MQRSEQHIKAVRHWFLVQGDKNLRLAYPLTAHSTVFDLGGYHGEWSAAIIGLYGATCHIFEPVPDHANIIRRKSGGDPRYIVRDFAVGRGDSAFNLSMADDGTSAFVTADTVMTAQQKDIVSYVRDAGVTRIALMKINIEGGEYDLLDYIIECGMIAIIDDLQIQFHEFVENAEARRDAIREQLALTHNLMYDFPFVWESWSRKAR